MQTSSGNRNGISTRRNRLFLRQPRISNEAGAPADLLDDILSMVGWDVFAGKEIEKERVSEWKEALEGFRNDFQIKELDEPIGHIREYLKKH